MKPYTVVAALVALGLGSTAFAAPRLERFFPAGGCRGSSFTAKVTGEFDRATVRFWVDRPGVRVECTGDNKLRVEIDATAEPGVCWVRAFDPSGASEPRPLIVGTFPELIEREPNERLQNAHECSPSGSVVNGRLDAEDVDVFAVQLKRGQTLVAELAAFELLGSPIDGVLQVVSPDGFVLAQNHDSQSLDPRVVWQAATAGTYYVRLFAFPATPTSAIRFAGGPDGTYRLTLSAGPVLDYVYPLATRAGEPGRLSLHGWNLTAETRSFTQAAHEAVKRLTVSVPGMAGIGLVSMETDAVVVEQRDSSGDVQLVPLPSVVSGRIEHAGEVDTYRFQAAEGQTLSIKVESQSLGFPLDGVLRLADADDNECLAADDVEGRLDPELLYSIALEGEYRVSLRDRYAHGGSRYAYRLRIELAEPDFDIVVGASSYGGRIGEKIEIPVTVERRNGFAEAIMLRVEGLPPGMRAMSMSRGGESTASAVTLKVVADRPLSQAIRIVAEAGGKRRTALAPISGLSAKTADLWITAGAEQRER